MKLNDFIFSYGLILQNFLLIKKNYFKSIRKLINIPINYQIYLLKTLLQIGKLNLDNMSVENNNFDYLFNKFNSDKAKKVIYKGKLTVGHNYSPYYEKYLKRYKTKKRISILEIGSQFGNSAAALNFYFKNSKIYCADINPFAMNKFSKRIRPIYIDTQSEIIIKKLSKYFTKKFDIIIDDGSHNIRDQIISLKILYPILKKGGTYVIEEFNQYKALKNLNPDNEKNTTKQILDSIKKKKKIKSKYLSNNDFNYLSKNIKQIKFGGGKFIQNGINISSIAFINK